MQENGQAGTNLRDRTLELATAGERTTPNLPAGLLVWLPLYAVMARRSSHAASPSSTTA